MSARTPDRPLRQASLLTLLAFAAIVIAQHAVAPELSPDRHTISEYVNARGGALMVAGFLSWAISLALTSAVVIRGADGTRPLARAALAALLTIAAVGMIITACFATQTSAGVLPPGVERSTSGHLHDLGSGAAMLALVGAIAASARLVGDPAWFRRTLAVVSVLALLSSAILLPVGDDVAGVRQRVLVACALVWQLALLAAVHPRAAGSARLTSASATDQLRRIAR